MSKIFISHSSANNAEALAMHDWLAEQGWGDVFLDLDPHRGLVAGDRWQAALKAAADQCELILILISPEWAASRWCLAEFLLAKQMNKQILGVLVRPTPLADLPVELTAEWQLVDLSAGDTGWSTTVSPPRYTPETTVQFSGTGLQRLIAGLRKAGLDANTFAWPPETDPNRAPYRGLLPLDADDAGIFFGRDGGIVLTLDALRGLRAAAAPRFATILGASGAGKSSFLRAGILPRLGRDSRHFTVLPVLRPGRAALTGEHGLVALVDRALRARNIVRNLADLRDAAASGAGAVAPLLRQLAVTEDAGDGDTAEGPPTLVLAVDQAEELLGGDNAEAAPFLKLLAELGAREDPAVLVIFTVRSDSFEPLQSRPELTPTQPHHLIDLPPIPAGAFGDIIRGPAQRMSAAGRKLVVEEPLVDALLADIERGGGKDALPLLAFTLERLYRDYGADGDLKLGEYERLGRVRGAIEAAVEQALGKADANPAIPRDRSARLALLRRGLIPWLAGIDPVTGSPRRRVARLAEVPAEARPLIDLMVEARLLATDVDKPTGERTIEPAHEALLRQWGALDGWLAEDAADLSLLEALRRSATDWAANGRGGEYLAHRGARLASAAQVAVDPRFADFLTSTDRDYLAAAHAAEDAAKRRAQRSRRVATIAATVAGVVLVAGLTAGWFIWSSGEASKRLASANFELAQSEAALRIGQSERAASAALRAYDLAPSAQTRTAALAAAMAVSPNEIARIGPDQKLFAPAWIDTAHLESFDSTYGVRRIDLETKAITAGQTLSVSPTASPFGGAAPVIGYVRLPDGRFMLFNNDTSITMGDGSVVAPPVDNIIAWQASSSDDGKVVVFTQPLAPALIRDCRTLPCTDGLAGAGNAVVATVSPDGEGVALVDETNGKVTLSIYRRGKPAETIPMSSEAYAIDWGEGGILAVAGAPLGTVYRIGDTTGPIGTLSGSDGKAQAIAVAADGTVAAPCHNGNICLYRPQPDPHQSYDWYFFERELIGPSSRIADLAFSSDSRRLVSLEGSGAIRVFDVEPDPAVAYETAGLNEDASAAFTGIAVDRARKVVAATFGGTVYSWAGDGRPQKVEFGDGPSAIAVLSDGRIGAVVQDKAIGVWTPGRAQPDKLIRLDNLQFSRLAALGGDIRMAVPLSDKTILTLAGDGLDEARIGKDKMPLDHWGIAAAPSANAAFISYSDGSIRRRDLAAGGEGATIYDAAHPICGEAAMADNNGARSLDVSSDGKWLAATRTDSRLIVHNLVDPARPICLALPTPDSRVVAFSPDATRLAVLSATDRLSVYDLARPDDAILLEAPAVPEALARRSASGTDRRLTGWLAWRDDRSLLIATSAGTLETINLDPAAWRARVDSLFVTP